MILKEARPQANPVCHKQSISIEAHIASIKACQSLADPYITSMDGRIACGHQQKWHRRSSRCARRAAYLRPSTLGRRSSRRRLRGAWRPGSCRRSRCASSCARQACVLKLAASAPAGRRRCNVVAPRQRRQHPLLEGLPPREGRHGLLGLAQPGLALRVAAERGECPSSVGCLAVPGAPAALFARYLPLLGTAAKGPDRGAPGERRRRVANVVPA